MLLTFSQLTKGILHRKTEQISGRIISNMIIEIFNFGGRISDFGIGLN
jgi:hypothetical protein